MCAVYGVCVCVSLFAPRGLIAILMAADAMSWCERWRARAFTLMDVATPRDDFTSSFLCRCTVRRNSAAGVSFCGCAMLRVRACVHDCNLCAVGFITCLSSSLIVHATPPPTPRY